MTRKNRRVFMDVSIDGDPVEKMVFELFYDVAPKTAENFRALCTGEKGISPHVGRPLHYKGCFFHHIVKGSMAQGGDFYKRDGSFGESIYGEKFPDESPSKLKHDERGLLSMSIADRDTRGSLFAITFRALDYLDRKNVVFGKVVKGDEVLEKIENVGDDDNGTPAVTVKIINCGEYSEDKKRTRSSRVSKHKKSSRGRRKKRRYYSSESETSTDSETDSSESESESDSESDISSSSDFSSSSDDRRKKRKRSSKKDKFKRNKRRNKRRERKRRNRDKRVKHTSKRSSISSESESSEDNGGAANDGKVGTESLAPKEKVASLPNQNREDIGWEKGELRRENGLRQRTHSNGAKANSRSRSISPNPATSKRVSISPRKTLSPNIGKIRPESKSLSRSPSESGRVIPVKGSPTLPPPPPRRSLSPSPVRPAPKNTSRSPIRFSLRNVNKSLMRGVSKAISRSPVRYARRSVSKSPVRPPQRSISKSPVRSSRKNMSISRSPIRGQKRNYTRSRSRSPVKSYARRYRSPTPDRSPVRSYRYGRSDRDSRRSPPRRYRSPPKHRSPLRYRSRRSGTRSPVRSFSPVVALRLRNSPRVERRKSLSHSSASRSSSDPPPPPPPPPSKTKNQIEINIQLSIGYSSRKQGYPLFRRGVKFTI